MAEGPSTRQVKEVYQGDTKIENTSLTDAENKLEYDGPFGIIDPRIVGFSYISYVFINSGEKLGDGFDTPRSAFDHKKRALMLGSMLGEYDFVHRRVDRDTARHAAFTVGAINEDEGKKAFIRNAETYPIFTVSRWHGQDVDDGLTNPDEADISEYEAELLYTRIKDPGLDDGEVVENTRNRILDRFEPSIFDPEDIEQFESNYDDDIQAEETVNSLSDHILGDSIAVNVSSKGRFDKTHVLVGLSVKPGIEDPDDEFDLPHEKVMDGLKEEFEGWEMPYIVSGVGKSWGDILVEMHISDIEEMKEKASTIRNEVEGIATTKTFAITNTPFNRPFVPSSPDDLTTD